MDRSKKKGIRPDYAKIIVFGAFVFLILWALIFILAANAGLEAEDASNFSIYITLLLFVVYVIMAAKYHERLGATVYSETFIEAYLKELSGGVLKCDGCGATTSLENFYKVERRFFSRKPKVYCPACTSERTASQHRKNLAFYGIAALAGLALVVAAPELPFGWILLNFFLGIIFMILTIVPHELGHVLAGTMLGMRIHKVTIGYGRLVYSTVLFGRRVEFRALPVGGLTFPLNKSVSFFRLRKFLTVAAGPLVNLLIVLILLKAYSPGWLLAADFGGGLEPAATLMMANVLLLVTNLVPVNVVTAAGVVPNDGARLLSLPFMKKPMVIQQIAAAYSYEGMDYRRNKDWDAARNCYEETLAKFPDNPISLNDKAVYFIETGELDNARDVLLGMLDRQDIEPNIIMVIKNNLAYADAISGRADLLDEADRLSEEAFRNASWLPAFKGTRGAVLVELGRLEEGIALLKEAAEKQEGASGKAANYCYLAIAEARAGKSEDARRYLEETRRLYPGSNLLARAEVEVTGAEAMTKTGGAVE